MARGGQRWSEKVREGQRRSEEVRGGQRRSEKVRGGQRRSGIMLEGVFIEDSTPFVP